MAVRNPSVTIINGTVDNSPVGATTPSTGTFTTLIGGGGSANYGQITGGATGKAVQFQSLGSDAAVSLAIQSKSTGAIDLAAGSSGVNISNGGTVTAITRTVAGSGYTTNPTPTISAPTTVGGTQATATCTIGVVTATVSAGGSGYVVGEILTVVGGTSTATAVLTVATISGSAVATVTITTIGTYTASPTNPAATTSNLSGTGATFTLSFGVNSAFTITGAGSGYVEQPTVTFSSGSATAYATVGSGTKIQTLGNPLSFYTPSGEAFRISDVGAATTGYWNAFGGANLALLRGVGSSQVQIQSASAVPIVFGTASALTQFQISHTASAVNYVQVTGAATNAAPSITAQGSDANIYLDIKSKGIRQISFYTGASTPQFIVSHTNSTANYWQATGGATGSAPVLSVIGSDTDIDLALTPKNAGVIKFGTYTGTILTPTGYITIKDSGGTTRRLLVG